MNVIDAQAREILLSRRRAIRRLIEEVEASERQSQGQRVADWLDLAVAHENALVLEHLTEVERSELAEIDAALERIAQRRYGQCESCGGPIGRQRLRAIPEARHCIGCSQLLARAS